MKIITVCIITIISLTSVCWADNQKNNYLMIRYENGWIDKSDDQFSEAYAVFENNELEKWSLGTKIVSGENDFKLLNPHLFFKITPNIHIGGRYSTASIGNDSVGPSIRYRNVLWGKIFTILDATQYFDLEGLGDKTDIWLHVSQAKKQGWYYGSEVWYYNIRNGTENLKLRPIKIGYKFPTGIFPFIMIQRHWSVGNHQSDSILGGMEIIF